MQRPDPVGTAVSPAGVAASRAVAAVASPGEQLTLVRPDPLEIAAGLMLGCDDVDVAAWPVAPPSLLQAVEDAVRRALQRPPCLVAFSGGRDSSAVLAVAAAVARREGLPLPVPATIVYTGHDDADEAAWQGQVLDHLGLTDAVRLTIGGELELLGPVARAIVERHGVLFPPNAHLLVPILAAAAGGSVVTGIGGDELFDSVAHPWLRVVAGHRRRHPRELRWLASALAPRRLRGERNARVALAAATWLTPMANGAARARLARAQLPLRWNRALAEWQRDRYYRAVTSTLPVIASPYGVTVVNPLVDPGTLAAAAHDAGAGGYRSRTAAMRRYFAELLPDPVLARSTKAVFDGPFWGAATAGFVAEWDGQGLDPALVDRHRFLAACRPDAPMPVAMAIQAAAWSPAR